MFVKICGLRTEADVAATLAAGADPIGFVLSASVRQVDAVHARRLTTDHARLPLNTGKRA